MAIIYGFHAVTGWLAQPVHQIKELFLLEKRDDSRVSQLLALAHQQNIVVHYRTRAQLDRMAGSTQHQGVVAQGQLPKPQGLETIDQLCQQIAAPLFVLLEGLQDPHNVGACLRTAEAAGADAVILTEQSSAQLSAIVHKTACGASFRLPLISVGRLNSAMVRLKKLGCWLWGADAHTHTILYEVDATGPLALVFGSEGQGLRHLTRERCDGLFVLPMQGQIESLNVSVACGVSLYEVMRQRRSSE